MPEFIWLAVGILWASLMVFFPKVFVTLFVVALLAAVILMFKQAGDSLAEAISRVLK